MSLLTPHIALRIARITALLLCFAMLTGCQSLSSTSPSARVRVIDLSPDAPALDVYQGNNALAYNLNFGTVTSYISIAPGKATFTVAPTGSRQALSTVEGTFAKGALYTVLVNSSAVDMKQSILTDHMQTFDAKTSPAPSVRLIHQATKMGAVDVYLVPAGQRITSVSPIATNLTVGTATSYLSVPICTCAAVIVPAGETPSASKASNIGTQTDYSDGAAHTLILVDSHGVDASKMQVITTNDSSLLE